MLTFQIKFNYLFTANPPETRFCEEQQTEVADFDVDEILTAASASLKQDLLEPQLKHLISVLVPTDSILAKADWTYGLNLSEDLTWEKRQFPNGETIEGYGIETTLSVTSTNLLLDDIKNSPKLEQVLQTHLSKNTEYLKALFHTVNGALKNFGIVYSGEMLAESESVCIFEVDDLNADPNPAAIMIFSYGLNPNKLTNSDVIVDTNTKQPMLCNLTKVIMTLPARDGRYPSLPAIDFEVYLRYINKVGKNPFNRQPMVLQDLVIDYELMAKIGKRLNEIKSTIPLRLLAEDYELATQEMMISEQTTFNCLMTLFILYKELLSYCLDGKNQFVKWEGSERKQIIDQETSERKTAANLPQGTCLRMWQEKENESRKIIEADFASKIEKFEVVKSRLSAKKKI